MRTIIIIVLGLFIAQSVNAQADSLIIKLGDYGQMTIASSNLTKSNKNDFGINRLYQMFYKDFKEIDKSGFKNNCYLISYNVAKWDDKNNRNISVETTEKMPDVYYFMNDQQEKSHSSKYCLKLKSEWKVYILLDSIDGFEKVSQINLDTLYVQALNHFQGQNLRKRNFYTVFYSSDNNKIDEKSNFIISKKSLDYLNLYSTIGMSVINSTFSPELNINMDIDFTNKGAFENRFGISSTFLFLPDKNDFFNINTYNFLNLNFSNRFKYGWNYKIGLGYMIAGNGSEFSKNTWDAYWQINVKKVGIKLTGFYTENNFGKRVIVPSIGFEIGF